MYRVPFIFATLAMSFPIVLCLLFLGTTRAVRKEDYRVSGLESVVPDFALFEGESYAGYVPTTPEFEKEPDGAIFFWLFEPSHPIQDDTLVIWLNGGPGCSSFDGLLFEHGPIMLPHIQAGPTLPASTKYDKLSFNPYSWTNATRMLYLEQPVGTGFSYGPEPEDETDVASDFYNFLRNFRLIFPHLKDTRLFIFGESYAGQYVPAVAHHISQQNKKTEDKVNLVGIGLGNAWIDSTVQGPAVIDYAWWRGFIDTSTRQTLHAVWDEYKPRGEFIPPDAPSPFHSFTTPDEIGILGTLLKAAGHGAKADDGTILPGPNAYETTTWDYYPQLYKDDSTLGSFFNERVVQEALHAIHPNERKIQWLQCIPGSGRRRRRLLMLDNDRPMQMERYLSDLLDDAKIRVLVYNGDRDMTTCGPATELALDSMQWSGQSNWKMVDQPGAKRGLWRVPGDKHVEPAGYVKTYKNLEFVTVYNSGHLMPTNRPNAALDLVTRMVTNQPLLDISLPIYTPQSFGLADSNPLTKLKEEAKYTLEAEQASTSNLVTILVSLLIGFAVGNLASRKYKKGPTDVLNGEAETLVEGRYGSVSS